MNTNKCINCFSVAPIAKCTTCHGAKEYTNSHNEKYKCPNCYGLGYIKLAFCGKCWRILKIAEKFPRRTKINHVWWRSKFFGGLLKMEDFPTKGKILVRKCNAMKESEHWTIEKATINSDLYVDWCTKGNAGTLSNFLEFRLP